MQNKSTFALRHFVPCTANLPYSGWCDSRDRIVVSTSRCGRDNPGENPGHGRAVVSLSWHDQPIFEGTISCNHQLTNLENSLPLEKREI